MSDKREKITPELALTMLKADLLSNSTRSKPTGLEEHVRYYTEQMKAGKWVLNDDPVIIDKDGGIVNGLARLRACVESGVSVDFLIVKQP